MTHLANVVKQAIERSQKFDGTSASQWTSAECRAVHAGVHSARDAIRRQDRTQRQACRERLGNGHDVGVHAVMLICKISPGSPQPALNFIENQQRSGALAQLPRQLQEFLAQRPDSALTLNCLEANGTHAAIELPFQILCVVERDKADARNQRRKRVTIPFLSRGCQRTKGASMKRILQRQQPPLSFMPVVVLRAGVRASELQCSLPCFSAAVTEECLLQS